MNIKTNNPDFKSFCDGLQLPCELADGDDNATPFIFIEGILVTKIVDLTKSPKFLMMKKIFS